MDCEHNLELRAATLFFDKNGLKASVTVACQDCSFVRTTREPILYNRDEVRRAKQAVYQEVIDEAIDMWEGVTMADDEWLAGFHRCLTVMSTWATRQRDALKEEEKEDGLR